MIWATRFQAVRAPGTINPPTGAFDLLALELKKHLVSVEVMNYAFGGVDLWEGSGRRLWGLERGSAGTGD